MMRGIGLAIGLGLMACATAAVAQPEVRSGPKGGSASAPVTSTPAGPDHEALDVMIRGSVTPAPPGRPPIPGNPLLFRAWMAQYCRRALCPPPTGGLVK